MTGRLEDKVAVITGGASGIGLASVELFLKEGAFVVAGDIQDNRGEELRLKLGNRFSYMHADVSREEDIKGLVQHAVEKFGRLDIMFNNAGFGGNGGRLEATDMEAFDRSVGILLKGVILGYKYATPHMKAQKSGSIISTASVSGLLANYGPHSYAALKAGVIQFSRSATLELGPFNVRSNVICPGGIATPIFGGRLPYGPKTLDKFAKFIEQRFALIQPIPRAGLPIDIAEMALFLASDASTFVTGQTISVDGGIGVGPMNSFAEKVDFSTTIREFEALVPENERQL
jgi:NAD(P)-dependent dehydrogenase (short-subunit alcohol dehydrogenase family)